MPDFLAALAADGPPLLADGAMGTMLQTMGLPVGAAADEWVETHPAAVAALHERYVAAGSQLVLTNTLNAHEGNFPVERVAALNRAAVALARRSGARWVAGSLGPGAGEMQARALAQAGVDIFWIETQLSLPQALATVAACQRAGAAPIVVTFSFHRPDGRTQAGETGTEVGHALAAAGVAAIGANCGLAPMGLAERLTELAQSSPLPLVLKPSAGLPVQEGERWHYPTPPEAWASEVAALCGPRVRVVGGCCGTTPTHLAALGRWVLGSGG